MDDGECTKNVEILETKEKGRMLIAKENIKQGDIVMKEKPILTFVTVQRNRFVCQNCLSFSFSDIDASLSLHCSECKLLWFCSEECQMASLPLHQKKECGLFQKALFFQKTKQKFSKQVNLMDPQTFSSLLFIIRIYCSRLEWKEKGEKGEKEEKEKKEEKEEKEEKENELPYKIIRENLRGNLDGILEGKVKYLKEMALLIGKILEIKSSSKEMAFLYEIICIEESNSHSLMYEPTHVRKEKEGEEERSFDDPNLMYGFSIQKNMSLLNHSCQPNLFRLFRHGFLHVFALRDIQKGEELCITYTCLNASTNHRRRELQTNYGFSCNCERCSCMLADLDFQDDYLCSMQNCGGLLIPNQEKERSCALCGVFEEINY